MILPLLGAGPAAAVPPDGCVVCSEYRSPVPGQPGGRIRWVFSRDDERHRFTVRDRGKIVGLRAAVSYDDHGRLTGMTVIRQVRGRPVVDEQVTGGGEQILILQDSMLPLDWFNCPLKPDSELAGKEIVLRKTIGRTGFVSRLLVQCREISFSDAVAAGMLNDDNRTLAAGKKLYLRQALKLESDERRVPVLRQLWAEDAGFWLYEEREGRRSWRCRP